tara:strand:+ start:197 stop:736 length:540 start_codon:yes stop_codon:yes gene_type:complete
MSNQMYGVVNGVYYCDPTKDTELSNRIAQRNLPSRPLQPQFSIRPVSTKYSILPVVDPRPKPQIQIEKQPIYNVSTVFNPGTAQAPWSGFASNINTESSLRRQFFAIQTCEQSEYIPSTKSDMYQVTAVGRQEQQPFPGLFQEQRFAPFNPNTCDVGTDIFNNSTREQLLRSDCCKNAC